MWDLEGLGKHSQTIRTLGPHPDSSGNPLCRRLVTPPPHWHPALKLSGINAAASCASLQRKRIGDPPFNQDWKCGMIGQAFSPMMYVCVCVYLRACVWHLHRAPPPLRDWPRAPLCERGFNDPMGWLPKSSRCLSKWGGAGAPGPVGAGDGLTTGNWLCGGGGLFPPTSLSWPCGAIPPPHPG